MTNNPSKVTELEKEGFKVQRINHVTIVNNENKDYLRTKAEKMNHKFD